MFEAIHGSAPRRAGQNVANPSGLLQGAIMMLNHIGQTEVAEKIQNAWLKTLEDGIHTYDIFKEGISKEKVSTSEFANAVIANLGQKPNLLKSVSYSNNTALNLPKYIRKPAANKHLVGVDLFVHWNGTNPDELAEKLKSIEESGVKLTMITNRGIKVWPNGFQETFCTDHWRCRYKSNTGGEISKSNIIELLKNALTHQIDSIKTENLYEFDGKAAYSLGQGQ
ncbi:MAG: isocitrate/isopropylmalate family dehydrogenase, partial [Saprospiraceae bacterium]